LAVFLAVLACENKKTESKEIKNLPYYHTPDFTPVFEETVSKNPHRIGNFEFIDQNNRPVSLKNVEGKIHVANFFFSSCGSICPAMMGHLAKVKEVFKNDSTVVLLSFSVTPWIDSPDKLKKYSQENGFEAANWHLLTGSKKEIYDLARQSYFAEEEIGFSKDSSDFLHTEHLILVDKKLQIRGIYNGTLEVEAMQLIEDIKWLKKE
jgi:protein SCO1